MLVAEILSATRLDIAFYQYSVLFINNILEVLFGFQLAVFGRMKIVLEFSISISHKINQSFSENLSTVSTLTLKIT